MYCQLAWPWWNVVYETLVRMKLEQKRTVYDLVTVDLIKRCAAILIDLQAPLALASVKLNVTCVRVPLLS